MLNRRGFEELLDRELERARRTDQSLSVIMVDLDHFKRLNDRLGHGMGDIALRKVAEVLDQGRRQIDTVARIGGEEFAVILPDTDENGSYVLAERLRSNISSAFLGTRCPLTASFGVSTFPDHGRGRNALMESCDQALYAAKELGRDRCVIFGADVAVISNGGRFLNHGESEARLATLLALAEALDLRDHGTAEHCRAVGRYAAMAARELGFDDGRVERVRIAGTLHDVGKVGLSESVLRKPGPLSDAEREEVQRHPELGAQILSGPSFDDVRQWVIAHHERPDGRGYPLGLPEDEIPLEASILAVADSYEAMTADRSYRPAMGDAAARRELTACSAEQFSPVVVEAFLRALERQPEREPTPV